MSLSYHGIPAVKEKHIAMAKNHVEQGMFARSCDDTSEPDFFGCSVECFAHELDPENNQWHEVVADASGWPLWLVHLSDAIFTNLRTGLARESFHVDLRVAVPVGKDLTSLVHRLAIARLERLGQKLLVASLDIRIKEEILICLRSLRLAINCHKDPDSADWAFALKSAAMAVKAVSNSAYYDVHAAVHAVHAAGHSVHSVIHQDSSVCLSVCSAARSIARMNYKEAYSSEYGKAIFEERNFLLESLRSFK